MSYLEESEGGELAPATNGQGPRIAIESDQDEEGGSDYRPSEDEESSSEEDEEDGEEGEEEDPDEGDWNEDYVRRLEIKVHELKQKLAEIQQQLASPSLSQNVEQQKQFISTYISYMQPQPDAITEKTDTKDRNILYILASGSSLEQNSAWLVKYLVEQYPSLLGEQDEEKRNSLFYAIFKENHGFVRAVLDSSIDAEYLAEIIESSWLKPENSVYLAISKDLEPDLTVRLIEKASRKTFGDQDQRGLTPLHLAVEYSRCTKTRLGVVLALLKHGDIAFDRRTGKPDSLSVYQYHVESRRTWEKDKDDKPKAPKSEKKKKASTTREGGNEGLTGDKKISRSAKEGRDGPPLPDNKLKEKREEESWAKKKREENAKLDWPPKLTRADTANINPHSVASPVTKDLPRGMYQANETRLYVPPRPDVHQSHSKSDVSASSDKGSDAKEKRPKQKKIKSSSKISRSAFSKPKELPEPEVADRIALELQLHYLRSTFHSRNQDSEHGAFPAITSFVVHPFSGPPATQAPRNHDSAVKFLYGDNKGDKQICFEFPPHISKESEKIDFGDFEASYKGLNFDKVLQYVDFRRVELKTLKARRTLEGSPGTGRKDMKRFFDWLYEKGVRNIIRVSVEDRDSMAHSDEAIESSLQRFSFEILDWRKIDLDPQAIRAACAKSNLRELHLWWSGNNAILRAWSEPDGLVQLSTLSEIHIHQTKEGLDSSQRLERNLEAFRDRLQKGRSSAKLDAIQVHHDKAGDQARSKVKSHMQVKDPERVQIDTHRWLTIMDKFADGIASLMPPSEFPADYMTHSSLPAELKKDVTVALIDDGVNFMNKAIADKLEKGRSFDNAYEDPDLGGAPDPFHGSTTGHGTYMAYMIGRVCPGVKIFVCKLNVLRRAGGEKASFTARSAADAVEFAVDRGFDIISMSWTVQRALELKNNNSADIDRLEKALKRAADQDKMLIFCSAPDIGMSSDQTLSSYYPFGSTALSSGMFKIGAAKADGTTYGWTGDSRSVDFILPGHNVELRGEDRITEEDDIPKTGSSVATALAAGLAALIIHCVRLGAIYNHHRRKGNDPNSVSEESLRAIKRYRAMKEAFVKVGRGFAGQERKDRNLDVENFFKDPGNYLGRDGSYSDEQKWIELTRLARDLVSWNAQTQATQK